MSDLSREVLSRVKPNNNERQEVSRTHSSDEVSVMEMERRGEQLIEVILVRYHADNEKRKEYAHVRIAR
ncbi:hypothetical protein SAG0027_03290 [Streptococcus agalactiae FSL S3-251]|uniref:hypothetical protein n=1 Tax=Streptococcus agalactiae TaxID=1311 RepID=UPI0003792018|nr:hypothetical protein [Streptococcus agalactiae]EPV89909.1 hypothetical protein SAG0027_03290 [Streptococcus agalactiae FSL S3-251]